MLLCNIYIGSMYIDLFIFRFVSLLCLRGLFDYVIGALSMVTMVSMIWWLPCNAWLDYTNLDDHIAQTSVDTPRFKPFTIIKIS